jgi:hypothetical protein
LRGNIFMCRLLDASERARTEGGNSDSYAKLYNKG